MKKHPTPNLCAENQTHMRRYVIYTLKGPSFFAVVLLLSASVELSLSNLAALRKGNPCVAYGHHLLRWLGDSGHGGKVPGSWHGQAAKPALGKRWQPTEQPCYKLIRILHKVLYGWAIAGPTSGCVTSPKFPGTAVLARPRPIGRRFRSVEPGREHSSRTLIKFIRRKGKAKEETGRSVAEPGVDSSTRREDDCNHRAMTETHSYHQTLLVLHVLCKWSYKAPFQPGYCPLTPPKGVKGKGVKGTTTRQN